jgi:broad specificity phosphatase PhoE
MKLHFIRHGESSANTLRIFSNQDAEHPLTEAGREQAQARASSLEHLQVDRIYTSPILRARQTAEILGAYLDAPVETTAALREWDVGIYEGTSDPQGWATHQQVQEDWFTHHHYESKMPGGESFQEIRDRFVPFIQELLQDDSKPGKEFILVAHGGLYRAMLPVILTNIDQDFMAQASLPYTAWIETERVPQGLLCISWCGEPVPPA